jgi:hypothetical protein
MEDAMKIYDVFSFYNEFDVLEIRLQELWDTVDYFILLEASTTYVGNAKSYLFEENKARFAPYLEKIRHIKLDDSLEDQKKIFTNEIDDTWVREKYQRWASGRGLEGLQPEDIVIVSDLDEVPRAEIIEMIREDENDYDRYLLWIPQLQYKINYMKTQYPSRHGVIMVTRGRAFTNPQQEREYSFFWNRKPDNTVEVDHGGWHFTYFGDEDHCVNKLKNFAHTEQATPEVIDDFDIAWQIRNKYGKDGVDPRSHERFEYVVVDDYFPRCITENIEKYQHMIIPDAVFHVEDLYRPTDKN